MVSKIRPGAIWSFAITGVFALAHPVMAAPDTSGAIAAYRSTSPALSSDAQRLAQKSNTVEKPKAATTAQAKPDASKPDAKAKSKPEPKAAK